MEEPQRARRPREVTRRIDTAARWARQRTRTLTAVRDTAVALLTEQRLPRWLVSRAAVIVLPVLPALPAVGAGSLIPAVLRYARPDTLILAGLGWKWRATITAGVSRLGGRVRGVLVRKVGGRAAEIG